MQTQGLQWETARGQPRVDCGAASCPGLTTPLCFAVQTQESWEPVFLTSSLSDACHARSRCYGPRKSISEWMNFKKWTWPQASPFFSQDVHSLLKLKCWISMVVFKLSSRKKKKKPESPHQSPSKTEKSWGDWESRTLSPIHLSLDQLSFYLFAILFVVKVSWRQRTFENTELDDPQESSRRNLKISWGQPLIFGEYFSNKYEQNTRLFTRSKVFILSS